MNQETFQGLLDYMKSKCNEDELGQVRIVSQEESTISTFVDIWEDIEVHPQYVRLNLVPETEWEDPDVLERHLLLPYSSILGITEETILASSEDESDEESQGEFEESGAAEEESGGEEETGEEGGEEETGEEGGDDESEEEETVTLFYIVVRGDLGRYI